MNKIGLSSSGEDLFLILELGTPFYSDPMIGFISSLDSSDCWVLFIPSDELPF
jgi:hypothetical protein